MNNMPTSQHPATLKIFFGTELWERYGFYVIQTLIALYLVIHLGWSDDKTYELVGSFTALTYISPILGGWIADRIIGQKRAVLCGVIILGLSYLLLSCMKHDSALIAALSGIAVGTGLLKPNISSLLGNEYPKGSSKRESGFTIFYMGITTGIILGTTLPSILLHLYGWPMSFGSAVVGMILSFFVFMFGVSYYNIKDYKNFSHDFKAYASLVGLLVFLWSCCFVMMSLPRAADLLLIGVSGIAFAYLYRSITNASYIQSRSNLIIALLCLISVCFWTFYFQMFMSLTLFIKRAVEPELFGMIFPPPYYVTTQSLGMIVFGYLLSKLHTSHKVHDHTKSIAGKFVLSMGCMTLSYLIIVLSVKFSQPGILIFPALLIPAYLIISWAELLLSPVGLSAMTVLASRDQVSTMMGIFFVSLGIGGFLSGKLATITSVPHQLHDISLIQAHYAHAFGILFVILCAAFLLCLIIYQYILHILKQMHCYSKNESMV